MANEVSKPANAELAAASHELVRFVIRTKIRRFLNRLVGCGSWDGYGGGAFGVTSVAPKVARHVRDDSGASRVCHLGNVSPSREQSASVQPRNR